MNPKQLHKEHVIAGSEKAYINLSEPIEAKTQCWKMMAPARMLEILDYSLQHHRLKNEERLIITDVKTKLTCK